MLNKGVVEVNFSDSQKMVFEMLMARICHLSALPDLKQILLTVNSDRNPHEKNIAQKIDENNDELISDILRSFEGSKLI
jgi:hypothetical protein